MKILNSENNMKNILLNLHNENVVIVTAFFSGTIEVVEQMLRNGCDVQFYTGTLNSFNNPDEIDRLVMITKTAKGKLSVNIDFNMEKSTHWKLYLVGAKSVYVGSANFTNTGLDLIRDTLVHYSGKAIVDEYLDSIGKHDYLNSGDKLFKFKLKQYRSIYSKRAKTLQNPDDMNSEINYRLPILIWEREMTKSEISRSKKGLKNSVDKGDVRTKKKIDNVEVFRLDEYGVYSEGQIVLCIKYDGTEMRFVKFDKISIFGKSIFAYELTSKFEKPFDITDLFIERITPRLNEWLENDVRSIELNTIKLMIGDAPNI